MPPFDTDSQFFIDQQIVLLAPQTFLPQMSCQNIPSKLQCNGSFHFGCVGEESKGNRRRSIGHCPHLWNPPLQPIYHSQQSYCMHPQKHHSTGTLVHCSCLTIKDFAVQAGMVAVETYIDVGNILWIFYDCLSFGYL